MRQPTPGPFGVSLNLLRSACRLSEVGPIRRSVNVMAGSVTAACAANPAFEVEFADDVGVTRKGPLAGLWSTRFERVNQARSFPSYRGQKNFTGLYYAATMDAHVGLSRSGAPATRSPRLSSVRLTCPWA